MDFIDNLKDVTPCIFFGAYGLGKSHILKKMTIPWLENEDVPHLYLPRFTADKETLITILDAITTSHGGEAQLSVQMLDIIRKGSNPRAIVHRISQEANELFPGKRFVLVLDDMELMSSRDTQVLMDLYDSVLICGAFSERKGRRSSQTSVFLDMFTRVPVNEFAHEDAVHFIDRLVRHFDITIAGTDMNMFRNYILNHTFYMTLAIVETLSRLRKKTINRQNIDNIPVHAGGRKEMSLSIKWVLILIIYPMVAAMLWRATGDYGLSYLVRAIGIIFIGLKLMMPKG